MKVVKLTSETTLENGLTVLKSLKKITKLLDTLIYHSPK